MSTIQQELKKNGYESKIKNVNLLGIIDDVLLVRREELSKMCITKYKQSIRGKINHRKPRKGKVKIMSENEIARENRIRAITTIIAAISESVVAGKDMYNLVYGPFGGQRDPEKAKFIQNILQHLKIKSNGMIILEKTGWNLNKKRWEDLGKPNIYTYCYPYGHGGGLRSKLRVREEITPILKKRPSKPLKLKDRTCDSPSGTEHEIGIKLDSHSITPTEATEHSLDFRKSAVITFSKNEHIIIERDGVTVEIIPSNYDLVKIVL